ncbi:DUF2474 domain-containing protein [Pantoea sp. App145]
MSQMNPAKQQPVWKRIFWMVLIYSASVLALGLVATLFRFMMAAAGMRTH